MLDDMPPHVRELADYMGELSDEAYCAKWMHNLEYHLWSAVLNGPDSFGRLDITTSHIEKLRKLSTECDGWIIFHPAHGQTYVSMEDWRNLFAQWRARRP